MKVIIPPNCNLQSIGSSSFSLIEEFYIPTSLRELKEEWCHSMDKLRKIIISPLNCHFIMKEDKYLLGKTIPKSDEFDNLLFAVRDINKFLFHQTSKLFHHLHLLTATI